MKTGKYNQKFWFWAWVVLATKKLGRGKSKNPRCLIWKNLILVSGRNETEAYRRACEIGEESESTESEHLTLDGKPAVSKFLGIADMGFIHDPLSDGCELYFREKRTSLANAKKSVARKSTLLAAVRKELSPRLKLRWTPRTRDPKGVYRKVKTGDPKQSRFSG